MFDDKRTPCFTSVVLFCSNTPGMNPGVGSRFDLALLFPRRVTHLFSSHLLRKCIIPTYMSTIKDILETRNKKTHELFKNKIYISFFKQQMMFYTMCFVLFIFFVLFLLPLHDVDITATVATATSSRSSLTPLMERFSIGLPASEQKNNIYIYK